MILVIDNFDSFVHNLARYLRRLGAETRVVRNDALTEELLAEVAPTHIVISPGPCSPAETGSACRVIVEHGPRTPILGVCLGHQCIGAAYGGLVTRAMRPMHGKASEIVHTGEGIFAGLPSPLRVGRYHSLAIAPGEVPAALEVIATTEEGEVMAVRHREFPVWGVQFHPESILTELGSELLANFLAVRGPA